MKLVTSRKFNHFIEKGLNLLAGKLLKRRNWFDSFKEVEIFLKQIDPHKYAFKFFRFSSNCLTYFVLSGRFPFCKGFVHESEGLWADWLFMIGFSNLCLQPSVHRIYILHNFYLTAPFTCKPPRQTQFHEANSVITLGR